jgi:hypothetical protein
MSSWTVSGFGGGVTDDVTVMVSAFQLCTYWGSGTAGIVHSFVGEGTGFVSGAGARARGGDVGPGPGGGDGVGAARATDSGAGELALIMYTAGSKSTDAMRMAVFLFAARGAPMRAGTGGACSGAGEGVV